MATEVNHLQCISHVCGHLSDSSPGQGQAGVEQDRRRLEARDPQGPHGRPQLQGQHQRHHQV